MKDASQAVEFMEVATGVQLQDWQRNALESIAASTGISATMLSAGSRRTAAQVRQQTEAIWQAVTKAGGPNTLLMGERTYRRLRRSTMRKRQYRRWLGGRKAHLRAARAAWGKGHTSSGWDISNKIVTP